MSDRIAYLALYLEGPMQAWGYASRYGRRTTLGYPTRSGLTGLLMAAMGAPRGDTETTARLNGLKFEILVLDQAEHAIRRWVDFHTVGGGYNPRRQREFMPRKANQAQPGTVVTHREYLSDARFAAVVSGELDLVRQCHEALLDPVWGIWLGRKSCLPTAPVSQGIHKDHASAVARIEEAAGRSVVRSVEEVEAFEDGTDSLIDVPLDFGARRFSQRRIALTEYPPSTN